MASGRDQRIAEEIRLAVGEALMRQEVKDPRVWDAGIITITHVKVTGDLRQARALFMVYGANEETLAGVKESLNKATGLWRRKIGERLRLKFTPTVTFDVDRVFESEMRVERALAEIADQRRAAEREAAEAAVTATSQSESNQGDS
jgi:ribosome-binding factor A